MERPRDFLTGVVFFGLLLVLGVFTIFLADIRLGATAEMTIAFPAVAGLEEGNEVRIDGLRSGKVERIAREEDMIHVTISFFEEPVLYEKKEGPEEQFTIASSSLLGGRVLLIESGDRGGARLDPTHMHRGRVAPDVLAEAGEFLEELRSVTAEIDWQDVKDSLSSIKSAAAKIDVATSRLSSKDNLVGRLLTDETMGRDFAAMFDRLKEATVQIENGQSVLGQLLAENSEMKRKLDEAISGLPDIVRSVEARADEVGEILGDIRGVTRQLSPEQGLGMALFGAQAWAKLENALVSVETAGKSIENATRYIESASARLEDKNNVVGVLLTDEQLPEKLKRSMEALSDFLESTRESAPFTTFAGLLLSPF